MTFWKLTAATLLFFFLSILQTSFLPHVSIMGVAPNLVFTVFFCIIFFEKADGRQSGFILAVAAGLATDIFSSSYFGAAIISFLLVYAFSKIVLYFLKESHGHYSFSYFIVMFPFALVIYSIVLYCLQNFTRINPSFNAATVAFFAYNIVCACVLFFVFKFFYTHRASQKQLKLFR